VREISERSDCIVDPANTEPTPDPEAVPEETAYTVSRCALLSAGT